MWRASRMVWLWLSLCSLASAARQVEVRVDARVELLTTLARLAEFREFNMPNSASPYAQRVAAQFSPFKEHAAVRRLKQLKAEQGVSYDAIASFAVHVGPLPELEERIAFERGPERLDARWGGVGARVFLGELREFARASKAAEFFAGEREFYAQVEQRLSQRLAQSKALPWFDAFFGARKGASYTAIPGLLCGGGNYGVGVRFPDGRAEEITPIFGCWTWDAQGLPVFGEGYLPLYIHELCHSYTNAVVDRFAERLAPALSRIHASCAAQMQRQGYGNWKTVAYESLVRASVVRCRLATEGQAAANEQAAEEVKEHFTWVPDLARLLGEFESDRARYASFEAFMPRVVTFFEERAASVAAVDESRPKVLSIEPRNGALDVDPGLKRLVITFDRQMRDQSWSIVKLKGERCPLGKATPAYDAARRVLEVAIELEPGTSYRFMLNSEGMDGFRSAEGVPLAPFEVAFTTRAP